LSTKPRESKEDHATRNRKYYSIHRQEILEKQRIRLYGLTQFDYDELLKKQKNSCAICKKSDWDSKNRHIDHDHKTGLVRGILCFKCNVAVAIIEDSPDRLAGIENYLNKFKGKE
jgi:hypothetical protein